MCVCTGRKKHLNLTEMIFSYAHWQIRMTIKLPKMAVSGQTNKQTGHVPVMAKNVVVFIRLSQQNQTSHCKSKTIRKEIRLSPFLYIFKNCSSLV